jgi:hypothetical protein
MERNKDVDHVVQCSEAEKYVPVLNPGVRLNDSPKSRLVAYMLT